MSPSDSDLFGEALKAKMDRQPGPLTSRGSALPVTPASASPAAAGASPPMSMLERLGRTLEGAGYGMKGQTPPYMMEEQQRAEQGFRKQQLDLQRRQVEQSGQHLAAQNAMLRQGLAKGAFELVNYLGAMGVNMTDEQADGLIERLLPAISMGVSDPESQTAAPAAGKAGVPTAAPAPAATGATTGFDLKPVLRGILKGQLDGSQLMEDMQDWTPKNRAAYVRLYAQDPSKAQTYHAQVTKSLDQTAQEHVLRSLAVLREKAPVQPNGQPWTPDAIVRELKLSGRRQRALTAMKPEDLAGYGVMAKSPEIMRAEAKLQQQGRQEAIGPDIEARTKTELQALLSTAKLPGVSRVEDLDVTNPQHGALIARAKDAVEQRRLAEAGERARVQVTEEGKAKRAMPVSAKDRASHIDIEALQKTGDLVQPPSGITHGALDQSGKYAFVDDEQRKAWRGVKRAESLVNQLKRLSEAAVTASTPQEALVQRATAQTGAFFKTNPKAATYKADRDAFLGNLSRELAAERGVLTQQDIGRVAAGLPDFGDTVTTRDLKNAVVREILDAARQGLIAEMTGRPTAPYKSQVQALLDKLEKATGPGGKYDPKTGTVRPK